MIDPLSIPFFFLYKYLIYQHRTSYINNNAKNVLKQKIELRVPTVCSGEIY